MQRGTVKSFDNGRGFGFIVPDQPLVLDSSAGRPDGRAGPADVFVHYSEIQGDGFKKLVEGERVEFVAVQTPKGIKATRVRRQVATRKV